jgi:exosortase
VEIPSAASSQYAEPRPGAFRAGGLAFLCILAVAWAYWPTIRALADTWSSDQQYSHGYFVPFFALLILWFRRKEGGTETPTLGAIGWGLCLLVAAGLMRLLGAAFYFRWLDEASLLPCLAGLTLLLGGARAFRWSFPSLAFLLFMIPLPFQMEVALARPLQGLATTSSTFALQTLGLPAVAEGNVIILRNARIGVGEACSGLGMLMSFFALATAVAILIRRSRWTKAVLILSAVPVAILVNVIRITATGILHQTVGSALANLVFHDLAGWLMMPLAVALLWFELAILSRTIVRQAPSWGDPCNAVQ